MEVSGGINIRNAWYDRSPVGEGISWHDIDVAPHAETVRATKTVPANKKMLVGSIHAGIAFATGIVSGEPVGIDVKVTKVDESEINIFTLSLETLATPYSISDSVHSGIILVEGDKIEILSIRTGGNGTINMFSNISYALYDA